MELIKHCHFNTSLSLISKAGDKSKTVPETSTELSRISYTIQK
jgi:hypothetical protein